MSMAVATQASTAPKEAGTGYLVLSPLLLVMVLGIGVPSLVLLVMSFWQQQSYNLEAGWGFANYSRFLANEFYLGLLFRSVGIGLAVALTATILAFPVAYFVAFYVDRYRSLWIVLLTLPFWTSYLLRIFTWKVILGFNGLINSGLLSLGFIGEPLDVLLYNSFSVVVTLTHAWMPFVVLPLYVSLAKIPKDLLSTAADLGDGPVRRLLRVVLPLAAPGLLTGIILVFIPTVGDYVTPMLVGGTQGSMIGAVIAAQFGAADNWPLGSAMSIITMIVVTCVALALQFGVLRLKGGKR
ncbi:MAG TPA: ABC transporter permease [Tianweitania sediminis]|nr:ABC transporter permease [Tianweitania sediminis]